MNTNFRWQMAQKAELNWWRNYLKKKDIDEYLEWKKRYWRDILSIIDPYASLDRGSKVMDAACGPAGIFMTLSDLDVVALDPLLDKYERELKHFNSSWYPYVTFVCEKIEKYNTEYTFDLVFCMNGINHVADIHKSMRSLSNMTAKKGRLVLTVDAHKYPLAKHIFRLLPGDILHPQQYTMKGYKLLLRQFGFSILHSQLLKKGKLFDHYILVAVNEGDL